MRASSTVFVKASRRVKRDFAGMMAQSSRIRIKAVREVLLCNQSYSKAREVVAKVQAVPIQ